MPSALISGYLARGLAAARPATPDVATGVTSFYYATDTSVLSVWDGSAWDTVGGGGGAIRVEDEGTSIVAAATALNFAGAGVTVTDAGSNEALVTIPGGGGGAWTLANTTTISTPVAQVDVTGLGTPTEIMVVMDEVTGSVTNVRNLLLSVDNGSTFFTTSGDYKTFTAAGLSSNVTAIPLGASSSTARVAVATVHGANVAASRRYVSCTNLPAIFTASTSQINAIRVQASTGNLAAGTIFVFTR